MDNMQVVIHAAGAKRDAARYWPANVQGTENLLTAAAHEGVGRFVHIISVSWRAGLGRVVRWGYRAQGEL